MACEITPRPSKTYATKANMERAIMQHESLRSLSVRYVTMTTPDGRYYPLFLGQSAIDAGAHFVPFCTAG